MSVAVRAVSASKHTVSLSSNMKDAEQTGSKKENIVCGLKKESADLGKDLTTKIDEKPDDCNEDKTQVKEDELKSNPELKASQVGNIKGDEILSKCKQQIVESNDTSTAEGNKGAEVQILSLSVLSPGRADVVLPIPFPATTSKATLFTLKEGSKYRIKFHFTVSKNTVTGLTYTYMVWKAGIRVHQTKKLMGTFSPRQEPYTFELEEGTTPTGFFARGPFFVRSKFVDDDDNCYLDTTYYFDIRKDWGARDKC